MEGNKVIISSSSFLAKKVEDKILLYHLRQINVTLVKNNCKSITSHMKKGKGAWETSPPPPMFLSLKFPSKKKKHCPLSMSFSLIF
jgi:hypothetical protein